MNKIAHLALNWDGSQEQKNSFHKEAKKWLNKVAKALGLEKGEFNVRSNMAGPAVLGDVILHSNNLYVNMGGSCFNDQFYYRSCKGQKDYTGGRNNWMAYKDIEDFEYVIKRFKNPVQ